MTDHSSFPTRRQFALSLLALPALGALPGDALAQAGYQGRSLMLEARLAERRRRYRIGEVVSLFLRVNQNAQVAILNIDALQRVTVLRPNRLAPSTHLPANRWLQFPAPGSDFVLQAAAPAGRNEIRVLATASQRPLLPPGLLRTGDDGLDRIDGGTPALDRFFGTQAPGTAAGVAERRIRFRVLA